MEWVKKQELKRLKKRLEGLIDAEDSFFKEQKIGNFI